MEIHNPLHYTVKVSDKKTLISSLIFLYLLQLAVQVMNTRTKHDRMHLILILMTRVNFEGWQVKRKQWRE